MKHLIAATAAVVSTLCFSTAILAHAGDELYEHHCASCHEGNVAKAPHRKFLGMLAPDRVIYALEEGSMSTQGSMLSPPEKFALAVFLTGKRPGEAEDHSATAWCPGVVDTSRKRQPVGTGWGNDRSNSRYFTADLTTLNARTAEKLSLDWVFGYPGLIQARSQPAVAYDHVFVGSADGRVYALDLETGCIRWSTTVAAEVRTAIAIRPADGYLATDTLVFGDLLANLYVLNASDGSVVWQTRVSDHPSATITGSPTWFEDRLYTPISSLEVSVAADPNYACCTFRGGVAAFQVQSGSEVWRTYTIPQPPSTRAPNSRGIVQLGPSGAPVWNSPTIDEERRLIYFGTGENYSSPADDNSDAIFALDLDTGAIQWKFQATRNDAWNVACIMEDRTNCPEENGPDLDFASSPHLFSSATGEKILIAAQKSGVVYGLDPKSGKLLWNTRVGRGGIRGGVHFGIAADDKRIYIPISDHNDPREGNLETPHPGLYALDPFSGELLWRYEPRNICAEEPGCSPGISAAITTGPGIVVACYIDGTLRIHDSESGRVIWTYNTNRTFEAAVNGVKTRGGSFSGPGAVLSGDYLILNSGYGVYGHMPGNALLVFKH